MSSTASTLTPHRDEPLTIARSKANCLFLLACVAGLYFCAGMFGLFFLLLTVWQALRTFMVRTVFYESRLLHRGLLGRTIWADYSKVSVLSSWPEAITLVGENTHGKHFEFDIGSLDGDTRAIQLFLKSRVQ